MQTDTCVFDAKRPVAINLLAPGGRKAVRVRFPSDDEWAERQRRRKVIIKNLGRGVSETTIANGEEVDAALLAKIRTEPEPDVDPFEAQKIMERWRRATWMMSSRPATRSGRPRALWAARLRT